MITYKEICASKVDDSLLEEIKSIYESESWYAYLHDDQKLMRAFHQSLYLVGAFSDEQLIGFVRCVGDGEHVLLVQDLIVHHDWQKQGIGTKLFQSAWEHYADVRQFFVVTDLDSSYLHEFYRSFGMATLEKQHCISFMRI